MPIPISYQETIQKWHAKQDGYTPPFRYEMGVLNDRNQFLLAQDTHGHMIIRRAGLYFDQLFCGMLQGRPITSLFWSGGADQLSADLKRVMEEPAIVKIHLKTDHDVREITLLPVRSDHGPLEVALGVIDMEQSPREGVVFAQYLDSSVDKIQPSTKLRQYGFAEPKKGFQGKKPTFTVITGNNQRPATPPKSQLNVVSAVKREP